MASNIEYEERCLALQKKYNQTLKGSVAMLLKFQAIQTKCDRHEAERYETRLALYMLIKVFRSAEKSPQQAKFHTQAEYMLHKWQNASDVLRNEALSGEGEKQKADEIFKKNVEAEMTRRWNSMEYNHIGTRTRESYREEVERLFKKEDQQ